VKTLLSFVKTTVIGGLFVVLPLLLFYVLMGEILDAIILLATPVAELFPEDSLDFLRNPDALAWLLILLLSILFGLAIQIGWVARLGGWVEAHTLALLPFYVAVKQVSQALIGGTDDGFKGGLLDNNNGILELVYILEYLEDGRVVVLLPFAPASFTGSVKIVEGAMVTELQVSVGEVSKVIAHWGVGTEKLLQQENQLK
jgi:uncharacterized membrane protein